VEPEGRRQRILWPALALPGVVWLVLLFLLPLYLVLAIAFGGIDPLFGTPVPTWNPLRWDAHQFRFVFGHLVGSDGFLGPAFLRTFIFVAIASAACLMIAYPVAYFTARLAGKRKGLILALLMAPFWISYMMRMLAWVNLLQRDGLINQAMSLGGVFPVHVAWLAGRPSTVVLGLVYGYVPYMILPLYAGLDRIHPSLLEASRDLGASRPSTFWRVTVHLSMPAIVASLLLTTLPMFGDYFTSDLLSASPNTAMVGNLINESVGTGSQTGEAAAFVVLLVIVLIIPMLLYVRSSNRSEGARA
jgi:ABC-type spermidine/putrescine transport system permease subunit I